MRRPPPSCPCTATPSSTASVVSGRSPAMTCPIPTRCSTCSSRHARGRRSRHSEPRATGLLFPHDRGDPAGIYGGDECCVVLLVLNGIRRCERGDRFIEAGAVPEI